MRLNEIDKFKFFLKYFFLVLGNGFRMPSTKNELNSSKVELHHRANLPGQVEAGYDGRARFGEYFSGV